MNEIEKQGYEIANAGGVEHIVGDYWLVKAQIGVAKTYQVNSFEWSCTCSDYTGSDSIKCKHVHAVEIWAAKNLDGAKKGTDERSILKREAYSQDWSAYNKAQTNEALDFSKLLYRLVSTIPQPVQGIGRPELSLANKTFACVLKNYCARSLRRLDGELKKEIKLGNLPQAPYFNTCGNWMNDPRLTDILHGLIALSGRALRHIETDFAIDSTGFSTSRFARWFNRQYGKETTFREWLKLHMICGVETNIITAADISGWSGPNSHDTNYFVPLLERTAKQYDVHRILADKAYLSAKNAEFAESVGAMPFIPIKSNTLPVSLGNSPWDRLVKRNEDESIFKGFYNKRNNGESSFSSLDRLFQKTIQFKNPVGQVNEALCKLVCYNIVVLIHEKYKRGIDPEFGEPTNEYLTNEKEMKLLLALFCTGNWPFIVKEYQDLGIALHR